jgi:hypothetical protein
VRTVTDLLRWENGVFHISTMKTPRQVLMDNLGGGQYWGLNSGPYALPLEPCTPAHLVVVVFQLKSCAFAQVSLGL